jgi:hypothetical protein
MRKLIFSLGLFWLFCLMLPKTVRADGIVLISSGGGVYDYGVEVTGTFLAFFQNQTVTISGLSGVTGASVDTFLAESGFTVESFTSSSVTFIQSGFGAVNFPNGTFGDLIVDSTVLTLGTVNWSAQTATAGTINGTVEGPVGSVSAPEPSSVALLLLGIGLMFAMRKHIAPGLSQAS